MMKRLLVLLPILFLALAIPHVAWAQTTYTWTGAVGDNLWTTPGNWSPEGVPGPEDEAIITQGTALVETPVTVGALRVGSSSPVSGGAFGGTADVTVNGALTWTGQGQFDGSGTVTVEGSASIEPVASQALQLNGRTLALGDVAPVAFPSGTSSITFNFGGVLEVAGAFAASGAADGTLQLVNNSGGTLRTTGSGGLALGGGTLAIGVPLDNAGTVSVASPATLALQSSVSNSGTIGGSGTLTVSNGSQFINTGTVAPGLSDTVAILPVGVPSNALPFGEEGRLEIEIGGLEPGTGYDRLAVDGAVALGGELALSVLDGFTPELGQTFEALTFTSRTGEFGSYTGTSLGNGLGLAPSFTDTSLVLTVAQDVNTPPVAVNDTTATMAGVAVLIDVLANDSDPDGDALTLAGVRPPENGTAEVAGDEVRYTPSAGFAGTDSFTYTVSDGNGGASSATVTVTVSPAANVPPVAVDDTATVAVNGTVLIDVLANDTDEDGDVLDLLDTSGPSNGTAEPEGEMVRYTPVAGFVGTDSFSYTVSDGNGGTDDATVTVTVVEAVDTTTPVCSGAVEGSRVVGRATDTLEDDPDNTGIANVVLDGSNLALTLTDPPIFPPSTPPFPEEVAFVVALADPSRDANGVVTVTDGAGNVCSLTVEFEASAIEVQAAGTAAVGNDYGFNVTLNGLTPTVAELRYRATGAGAFDSIPLTQAGEGYVGSIPAAAVTLRGVEYYVFFSDGERTVTFPSENPEANPLRVRVNVDQQASDVVLPSDASSITAYRMVSVPLVLDDPSPLAVFGDDYGEYGPTSWRLLRHLPLGMAYSEFPELNADIVPGAGFWLAAYADDDGPFDVENGRSVDASEPALLNLPPGWSQIGNPFAFPVLWDAVLGSDLVQPPASFDGSEFVLGETVLDPWVGYFVLNDTEEPVTLEVPPLEGGLVTRPSAKGSNEQGYRLHLRADAPERGLRDTQNVLGFAEGVAVGHDRLDLAEPPPIGPHLRLSAVEDGVRLGHSFRPAGTDGADWELELSATPDLLDAGPVSVRVALEEVGGRPTGYDLHVLDLDGAAPLTLLEGAFEITLSPAHPTRRLRLIAGTDAYAEAARQDIPLIPVEFALSPAYPNPFAGSATLAYQLPEQADVVLDVFDLLGRRVAVLADGVQEAGRYSVRWDGTVAGAPAANGVYVYRLRAGSFTATHKIVLLR